MKLEIGFRALTVACVSEFLMLPLAFVVGVAVMGKARSLEAKLARLKQLRDVPHSAEVARELRAGLGDASGFVVAQAAELVTPANGPELAGDLLAAFDRLNNRGIIVFGLVDTRRDRPHPHQMSRERLHQVARVGFSTKPTGVIGWREDDRHAVMNLVCSCRVVAPIRDARFVDLNLGGLHS